MTLLRRNPWIYFVLAMAPLPVAFLFGRDWPDWLRFGLAGGVTLWGLTMAVLHWKRIDETAKAAHRWAWYWGGSAGLAVAAIGGALAFTTPSGSALIESLVAATPRWPGTSLAFWYGIVFAGLAQAIGWAGCWLGWWASRR